MGRLTTLKPRVQTLKPSGPRTIAAGDDRIRGNSLQAIRRRIFDRDCGLCVCVRCRESGAVKLASIVDHRVPLWAGGTETDGNRQSMAAACHDLKSADEARMRAVGAFDPTVWVT